MTIEFPIKANKLSHHVTSNSQKVEERLNKNAVINNVIVDINKFTFFNLNIIKKIHVIVTINDNPKKFQAIKFVIENRNRVKIIFFIL